MKLKGIFKVFTTLLLCLLPAMLSAQHTGVFLKVVKSVFAKKDSILLQELKGRVFDKETHLPLPGATILLRPDDAKYFGTVSDPEGNFIFRNVPVNRYDLQVSFVGYHNVHQSVIVNSSRTTYIDIPLEQSPIYLSEINVSSFQDLIPVGSNIIDQAQFKYHPGNRYEVIRKVHVMPGAGVPDDSRNDVIVRGNSPQSISWRIEGVNVPNPNHFNIPGTSGGPVAILNDKMLGVSQFYSGAFPAEYGNTTSGIFDLHFRNGDSTKFQGTLQFGFLGAEGTFEGPLNRKKKSTFIFSARRSVLGLMRKLDVDIGTSSRPRYSDAAFKLNFPLSKRSMLWVFGLGGKSDVDILISKQFDPNQNLYGEKDRDQFFSSNMGMIGTGFKYSFGKEGYFTHTLAYVSDMVKSNHKFVYPRDLRNEIINAMDEINPADTLPSILRYNFRESRLSGLLFYTRKVRSFSYLNWGLNYDLQHFDHVDSAIVIDRENPDFGNWHLRWDSKTESVLLQPFAQWKYSGKKMDVVSGLHGQYLSLSKSYSIEPRLSFRYYLSTKSIFNAGFGLHSQMHQPYLYFFGTKKTIDDKPIAENRNLDFTRSVHALTGFQRMLGSDTSGFRLKVEVYYQWLYDVPVERDSISAFSLINAGADFKRQYPQALVNEGEGKNYGLEAMLEKSFSNHYMFLITGSFFQSKYKGSDEVWRNTDFNARYIINVLATREWNLKKQNVIAAGAKFTTAGGRWYGPVDMVASRRSMEVVYEKGLKNIKQFPPYYRFDLRISYKVNLKRVTHEFSVDMINIFDNRNTLKLTYIPDMDFGNRGKVDTEYQLGFIPFFYYRLDF